MNQQVKEKKKSANKWLILFVIALLLAIVGFVLYFNTLGKTNKLIEEKNQQKAYFQQEIDSLLIEHDKVKTEYKMFADSMNNSILAKDSVILANAKEIKKLLNTKWEYRKVQKKLAALREIAQGYLVQIDSLYTVNKTLKDENIKIKTKYQKEKKINQKLIQEKKELNQIVEKASVFKVFDIEVIGVKETWTNKLKETNKARRADKFRICFTVGENDLIDNGEIELFFRIASPEGKILSPSELDDYAFTVNNTDTLQYTMRKVINYEGKSFRKCIFWNKPKGQSLKKGKYIVDIYTTKGKVSQTYIELK